jgi:hypothetical protein
MMDDIRIALNRLILKVRAEIPKRTSQLINDSGFITSSIGGGGGTSFTTDETLSLKNGVLSVNTATDVEADNTLPVTSAAVYTEVGNINALLETI